MDYKDIQPHPNQRKYDLIFGIFFLGLGGYRMFELFNGASYSKFRIVVGVFMTVLGVFKLYAYLKTRRVAN